MSQFALGSAAPDVLARESSADPFRSTFALGDLAQIPIGAFKGVLVEGNKALWMAGAGFAESTGMPNARDWMFARAKELSDYWDERGKAESTAGEILGGVSKGLSQFATLGVSGAAATVGINRAMTEVERGKTLSEAYTLAALDTGVTAIGGALPFKLPTLGPASWSTGYKLAAQRIGYGVASNVVPGIAQRAIEGNLLESWGYKQEAAGVKVFDPTAIAIDAILGTAMGGYAAKLDYTAQKVALTEQRATLEGLKESADPVEAAKIDQHIKATDDMLEVVAKDEQRQTVLDVELSRARDIVENAKLSEDVLKAQALAQTDDLTTKLRILGEDALADRIEGVTPKADPELVDSAMVANEAQVAKESQPGMPADEWEQGKGVRNIDEAEKAIDEGRQPELEPVEVMPDPEKKAYLEQKARVLEEEGLTGEQAYDYRDEGDWTETRQESGLEQAKAASDKIIDRLPDDYKMTIEDDDGTMRQMSKEEYRQWVNERMAEIDDEGEAMSALVSCMLRG